MRERPILFTPENAQKVHADAKKQTRRVIKPQPDHCHRDIIGKPKPWSKDDYERLIPQIGEKEIYCPFGIPGDRLWIRESYCIIDGHGGDPDIVCYRGDKSIRIVHIEEPSEGVFREFVNPEPDQENCADDYRDPANDKWQSAMFMPRYACRTIVEITDVRVERVQSISEKDIKAEGVIIPPPYIGVSPDGSPIESEYIDKDPWWHWQQLWDSINAKTYPWSANPWVWALSFKRILPGENNVKEDRRRRGNQQASLA